MVNGDAGDGVVNRDRRCRRWNGRHKFTKESFEEIAAPQCHFRGSVFMQEGS